MEFEIPTDWNLYVDLMQTFLSAKLKLVKGRRYDTFFIRGATKAEERIKKRTAEEQMEEEEDVSVPPASHIRNILLSFFPKLELYISNF